MKDLILELSNLKSSGSLRFIPDITAKNENKVILKNKELINFASNDYLGISTDKNLKEEFFKIDNSFMSSASARLLSGTSQEYKELENTLSKLFNKEACLIFSTGYQCNLGVISALCSKGDVIFSDKLNHASIIDGMRLANGEFIRYRHNDYEHLETILKKKRKNYKRAIIVSESIFSMDGDIANIDKLIELKKEYNCLLMIDEAHAFATIGETLAGLCYNKDVDVITATLGKALGSFGAFCVANKEIISYLTNKSRSFIFSTSLPPIIVSWTNWLLTCKNEYLTSQKNKLNKLIKEINDKNFKNYSETHIIPIITGSNENTLKISEKLLSMGYYVPAIRPPTVPEGSSRLRISLTANTDLNDINNLLSLCFNE